MATKEEAKQAVANAAMKWRASTVRPDGTAPLPRDPQLRALAVACDELFGVLSKAAIASASSISRTAWDRVLDSDNE